MDLIIFYTITVICITIISITYIICKYRKDNVLLREYRDRSDNLYAELCQMERLKEKFENELKQIKGE